MSDGLDPVAVEHVLWCANEGWTPIRVIRSVERDWPEWAPPPRWEDAVAAIAAAETQMRHERLQRLGLTGSGLRVGRKCSVA